MFIYKLETLDKEIWHIMRRICLIYTKYFNEKYQLAGHLFQGRYHAVIVEDDGYLLQTSRHIHLNPVKACMVDRPADYPWSSYTTYLGMQASSLITVEKILGFSGITAGSYIKTLWKTFHSSIQEKKSFRKAWGKMNNGYHGKKFCYCRYRWISCRN